MVSCVSKKNPAVSCGAPTIKPPLEGWILTEKFGNYRAVTHNHDRPAGGGVIFLGVINAQRMHETRGHIIRLNGLVLGTDSLVV